MSAQKPKIRVLELYCGIGGMHYAVKASYLDNAEVVAAVDISPLANSVYCHNFPQTCLLEKGIEGFSVKELDQLQFNLLLMSPPCQPYTRVGLKKDTDDPRSKSFLHLLETLRKLKEPPFYILLENVKGFEESKAYRMFCDVLDDLEYDRQGFLVSPKDIAIPNSRLRFYLLARRKPLSFNENWYKHDGILEFLPNLSEESHSKDGNENIPEVFENSSYSPSDHCLPLKNFLEKNDSLYQKYKVPEAIVDRYLPVMDIVSPDSTGSTCFTKSYGHYVEGTGSILCTTQTTSHLSEDEKNNLSDKDSCLRYFSPREVSNLMGFPKEFEFPKETSRKQRYRLLGNSLNVRVVTHLLNLLLPQKHVLSS